VKFQVYLLCTFLWQYSKVQTHVRTVSLGYHNLKEFQQSGSMSILLDLRFSQQ
jgi:hypothetical protein